VQCGFREPVLDFCETNYGAVVTSTAAFVSGLQGDFENMSFWNPHRIFFIISDMEKLKMAFHREFYVESKYVFFSGVHRF